MRRNCQVFSFCVTCMPALEPSCGIGPPTFGAISQKAFDFWGLCQPLLQRLTTFAFRVQILAICSNDYFWTFGELGFSQIAPPPLTACNQMGKQVLY